MLEQVPEVAGAWNGLHLEHAPQGAEYAGVEEIELGSLPELLANGRVEALHVEAQEGVLQDRIPGMNGLGIAAHVPRDASVIEDLARVLGRHFEKAPERLQLADHLFGLDLLLEVGKGVGAQEIAALGIAGGVPDGWQSAEAEGAVLLVGLAQLSLLQREQMAQGGPSRQQVGPPRLQLPRTGAGQDEALRYVVGFDQVVDHIQQARQLLDLVDHHVRHGGRQGEHLPFQDPRIPGQPVFRIGFEQIVDVRRVLGECGPEEGALAGSSGTQEKAIAVFRYFENSWEHIPFLASFYGI